eukprot:s1252_g14.t1
MSRLHAEALEESTKHDFEEDVERPDRPESDSTMVSSQGAREAQEVLKSAMTSPEASRGTPQGKESARVRISLPESLTESELGELPTYSKGLRGADNTKTYSGGSGEHSYGLFSRGLAAGQAARTKFRRTFSLKAAISRVKPHRVPDRHQFWNTNFPQDYAWLEVRQQAKMEYLQSFLEANGFKSISSPLSSFGQTALDFAEESNMQNSHAEVLDLLRNEVKVLKFHSAMDVMMKQRQVKGDMVPVDSESDSEGVTVMISL